MSGKILLVDDDATFLETVLLGLRSRGYEVMGERLAERALALLDTEDFEVVLTDLRMPALNGLEFCERVAAKRPALPVILLTSFGSFETAVGAIRAGAYDFLSKPVRLDALQIALERAIEHHRLQDELRSLRLAVRQGLRSGGLVARSPAMQSVLDLVGRVAGTPSTVLLTGEKGTGKETLARALHERSGRAGAFVTVACGASPPHALETELFGYARGAVAGRMEAGVGLLTEAHRGTLLLDEVADLPLELQAKVLRSLQERTVRPVGGRHEHTVDLRIIATTARDLEGAVEEGRFREDLYAELSRVRIALPSLRARSGDILLLAQSFLEGFAKRAGKQVTGIAPPAAERLLSYGWPGNVRELQGAMERAVTLTRFAQIGVEDLPDRVRDHHPSHVLLKASEPADLVSLDEVERRYILHVLETLGGNKAQAARVLGIERRTLYRKLEQWSARPAP